MVNPIETLFIKTFEKAQRLLKNREQPVPPSDGLLLCETDGLYQPAEKEDLYLSVQERLRHVYTLGATGSGKSKLIEFMIRQDILSNRGFCLIDPHGDLYQNILGFLSSFCAPYNHSVMADQIAKQLVLIDPTDMNWATGFNPLEAAGIDPYSQSLEFMGIFKKLWSDAHWGPRMEELLRNTFVTLSINGLTLLEAKTLLINAPFRARMIESFPEGEVKEYWMYRYDSLSESMKAVYREPILNRLSVFLSNPNIRAMIGQTKSTINFRQIMDQGKWLLVNLSKGQLKSNAHLLGALIIAKLQLAALSRVDINEANRFPFFVYVDEFQNFINENFEVILSEARKYGLGLMLAHQNIDQLDRQLRAAILGNTFTQIFFRLSHQDASSLSAELSQKNKTLIQRRLVDLGLREAYVKKKGEHARAMKTVYTPAVQGEAQYTEAIKRLSMGYYAKQRTEVDQEIQSRLATIHTPNGQTAAPPDAADPLKNQFAPKEEFEEGHDW